MSEEDLGKASPPDPGTGPEPVSPAASAGTEGAPTAPPSESPAPVPPSEVPPAAPVEPVAPAPAEPAGETAAPAAAKPKAPMTDEEKAAAKAAALEKAAAAKAAKAAAEGGAAAGAAPGDAAAAKPAAAKPKPAHEDDSHKPVWERDPIAPDWQDGAGDVLTQALKEEFGDAIESARSLAGDLTFLIRLDAIAQVSASLKEKHRFTYLIDVCGVDFPKRTPRFDVVYHLHRFEDERRIRLRVSAGEDTPVPSVCGVWRAANWSEREVYDMYGVRFSDHPDMSRILLWEGFNGYPLRKDFPVEGIDTGSAIYPEYYEPGAGPVAGTGTGWKPPKPPAPPAPEPAPAPAAEKKTPGETPAS